MSKQVDDLERTSTLNYHQVLSRAMTPPGYSELWFNSIDQPDKVVANAARQARLALDAKRQELVGTLA